MYWIQSRIPSFWKFQFPRAQSIFRTPKFIRAELAFSIRERRLHLWFPRTLTSQQLTICFWLIGQPFEIPLESNFLLWFWFVWGIIFLGVHVKDSFDIWPLYARSIQTRKLLQITKTHQVIFERLRLQICLKFWNILSWNVLLCRKIMAWVYAGVGFLKA